jgi:hypothetical protein
MHMAELLLQVELVLVQLENYSFILAKHALRQVFVLVPVIDKVRVRAPVPARMRITPKSH